MNIDTLLSTHHVVTDSDILDLLETININPEQVIVRSMFHDQIFPSTEVVHGPFTAQQNNGQWILSTKDGAHKLRITEDTVVEIFDNASRRWKAPSFRSVKVYIPNKNEGS